MLDAFFWVIPWRLKFICRRFETLCSIFIGRYLPMRMEHTECSETSAYKFQTPGNHPKENIQQFCPSSGALDCVIQIMVCCTQYVPGGLSGDGVPHPPATYWIHHTISCITQFNAPEGRSQWPRGLRRRSTAARPLRLWVRIPPGHVCLSVVSVVCCQVEVSATDWSLVQRSPTDCGASLCVIKKPREWGG